jgi:hypothetical protein
MAQVLTSEDVIVKIKSFLALLVSEKEVNERQI